MNMASRRWPPLSGPFFLTFRWKALLEPQHPAIIPATQKHFPEKEARRPKKGDSFNGRLDVYATGRRLTITRDFNTNKFQVFDKEKGNLEITSEFIGPNGEDELGQRLTGMTRELFKSTCFVGQRELDEHAVGGESTLVSMVQGIADSATPSATSAHAVKVLKEICDRVPVGEKTRQI